MHLGGEPLYTVSQSEVAQVAQQMAAKEELPLLEVLLAVLQERPPPLGARTLAGME